MISDELKKRIAELGGDEGFWKSSTQETLEAVASAYSAACEEYGD